MIKAIYFDFSKVIATSGYLQWANNHITDPLNITLIEMAFRKLDLGNISRSNLEDLLSEITSIPAERIRTDAEGLISINSDMVELIKNLKKSYEVALLSNYAYEILEPILSSNDLNDLFDEIIISSRLGVAKPDKAIFEAGLVSLGILPKEALFIDNSHINVSAANTYGINSILFASYDQLVKDLKNYNIVA